VINALGRLRFARRQLRRRRLLRRLAPLGDAENPLTLDVEATRSVPIAFGGLKGGPGGYGARVFGTLLEADVVLSFAPQIVFDLEALAAMDDHRRDDYLKPLTAAGVLDPEWTDLRALPAARRSDMRHQIYFDDSLTVDRLHAERLAGLEGARLYRFGRGAHSLVRELRDARALVWILGNALHAPLDPHPSPSPSG
jgi:hypothetical protein